MFLQSTILNASNRVFVRWYSRYVRPTTAYEKVIASVVNVIVIVITVFLIMPLLSAWFNWKLVTISIFFTYQLVTYFFRDHRDLGMLVVGSFWDRDVHFARFMAYVSLYTVSFGTLLYSIWFPLDLFLMNILFLQLPSVVFRHTTFHGLVARLRTVRNP